MSNGWSCPGREKSSDPGRLSFARVVPRQAQDLDRHCRGRIDVLATELSDQSRSLGDIEDMPFAVGQYQGDSALPQMLREVPKHLGAGCVQVIDPVRVYHEIPEVRVVPLEREH